MDRTYTRENLILWEDLEIGRVREPNKSFFFPNYARENLTKYIPVDTQGNLLSPMKADMPQA